MKRGNTRRGQRGVAYLGVLLLVTAVGLGMVEATRIWHTVRQREREAQLLFVGDQFRAAIANYYNAAGGSRYPSSLEELLEDRRALRPVRHLRRLYVDPLTDTPAWGLVKAPDGGIMGVYSEAPGRPLKRQGFPERYEAFVDKDAYSEWVFVHLPAAQAEGAAGRPGSGPTSGASH